MCYCVHSRLGLRRQSQKNATRSSVTVIVPRESDFVLARLLVSRQTLGGMGRLSLYVSLFVASIALSAVLYEYENQRDNANDRYASLGTVLSTSAKIFVYSPQSSEFEVSYKRDRVAFFFFCILILFDGTELGAQDETWVIIRVKDVGNETDWVKVVELRNLSPSTRYTYFCRWDRLLPGQKQIVTMKNFMTLSEEGEPCIFSFVFSSCWSIFPALPPLILSEWRTEDFALFLGDSHYSDLTFIPQQVLYKYMIRSPEFRNMTTRMGMFSMFDDHVR